MGIARHMMLTAHMMLTVKKKKKKDIVKKTNTHIMYVDMAK